MSSSQEPNKPNLEALYHWALQQGSDSAPTNLPITLGAVTNWLIQMPLADLDELQINFKYRNVIHTICN